MSCRRTLQKQGVGTEVYYPVPMHLQECFAYPGPWRRSVPRKRTGRERTLALPDSVLN